MILKVALGIVLGYVLIQILPFLLVFLLKLDFAEIFMAIGLAILLLGLGILFFVFLYLVWVPLVPIGLVALEFYILFFSTMSLFDKTIWTLALGSFLLIFWFWINKKFNDQINQNVLKEIENLKQQDSDEIDDSSYPDFLREEVKPIEISGGSDWFNNWERQKILLTKNIARYSSFVFIVVVIIGFLFSWFNWIQQRKIEFIRKANAESWDGNYNAAFKSWQDAARLDYVTAWATQLGPENIIQVSGGRYYDNRDIKDLSTYIMNNLAEAHYAGLGTPKNIKEAIRLWKQAAELGDAGAMCHLAHMYNNGRGVPKDFKKALKFWKKAAELGNYRSLEILEASYANEFTKDELETIRQKCSEAGCNVAFNVAFERWKNRSKNRIVKKVDVEAYLRSLN
jgi:hypothetical protein